MTACVIQWKLTWKTWSEWLRRIWGVDQPAFICWIGWNVLGFILSLGTVWCCPIQQLGCFFLFLCLGLLLVQPSHLLIPFLFCTFFHIPGLTPWVVFQNTLCGHAGEWLTCVTCYSQPVMHLWEVGGIISVFPLSLKHKGQNDFSPPLEERMGHLKASPECRP